MRTFGYLKQDLEQMSKGELGVLMNELQNKVDSGSFQYAHKQLLEQALDIYVGKFEGVGRIKAAQKD